MKSLPTPEQLLAGLDTIAEALSRDPDALALLALGSCGSERDRLDEYSDLDFFVIVEPSAKARFIEDLKWLDTRSTLVFAHKNTVDGWKTLDNSGMFCEFAVFHIGELANIPYQKGRIAWAQAGFDVSILAPHFRHALEDRNWLCREALTNILVGLKRYLRGEESAAMVCVGVEASALVCRYLKAAAPHPHDDGFNPWRRLEATHPQIAEAMQAVRGHRAVPAIARALMASLEPPTSEDAAIVAHIQSHLDLCDAR